jgi:hypothetical protein
MLRTQAVLDRLLARGFHVERNRLWRISAGLRLRTRSNPRATRSWTDDQVELIHIALQLRQSRGLRPDFVYELAITVGGTPDPLVEHLRALYAKIRADGYADPLRLAA